MSKDKEKDRKKKEKRGQATTALGSPAFPAVSPGRKSKQKKKNGQASKNRRDRSVNKQKAHPGDEGRVFEF